MHNVPFPSPQRPRILVQVRSEVTHDFGSVVVVCLEPADKIAKSTHTHTTEETHGLNRSTVALNYVTYQEYFSFILVSEGRQRCGGQLYSC